MKNFIKKILNESLKLEYNKNIILLENYKFHDALNNLAKDVFSNAGLKLVNYIKTGDRIDNYVANDVLNGLVSNDKGLNDFINDYNLTLRLAGPESVSGGEFNEKGFNNKDGIIMIETNMRALKSTINYYANPEKNYDDSTIKKNFYSDFSVLSSDEILPLLAHELQHAYDSWRSKGKFSNNKRTEKFKQSIKKHGYDYSNPDILNQYLRLPHEINAMFSETINNLNFFDTSATNGVELKSINKIIQEFKENFWDFNIVSPTEQKRLINRLVKVYNDVKEDFIENKKKNM